MFGMGFMEIFLVLVVAIIALGPEKLPSAMVDIAKFFRKFKSGIEDAKSTLDNELNISEMKKEAEKFKASVAEVKSIVDFICALCVTVNFIGCAAASFGPFNEVDNVYIGMTKEGVVSNLREAKMVLSYVDKDGNSIEVYEYIKRGSPAQGFYCNEEVRHLCFTNGKLSYFGEPLDWKSVLADREQ